MQCVCNICVVCCVAGLAPHHTTTRSRPTHLRSFCCRADSDRSREGCQVGWGVCCYDTEYLGYLCIKFLPSARLGWQATNTHRYLPSRPSAKIGNSYYDKSLIRSLALPGSKLKTIVSASACNGETGYRYYIQPIIASVLWWCYGGAMWARTRLCVPPHSSDILGFKLMIEYDQCL